MRRIGFASFVGTVIEFYDFMIYGTAAAVVFPRLFFPVLGERAAVTASFATLGVAFFARPLGAVVFGHFGDLLGRKGTLVSTLLLMGIATVLVGLLPTAAQIGVLAPLLLVALRILQGIAAGGEWVGAVLFGSEHAPAARRGFWASMPALGGGAALFLANVTFMLTGIGMSEDEFLRYGWRIPFLLSIVLIVIGLFIRLSLEETPAFEQRKSDSIRRVPFIDAFRSQPKQVALAAGALLISFTLGYIGSAFLTNYGRTALGLSRTYVLAVGAMAGLVWAASCVFAGSLSDRVGRRRVIFVAAVVGSIWSVLLFPIIETQSEAAFGLAVAVTFVISGFTLGPVGALLTELFHTRLRYTAAGVSYNIAAAIGGAIPPIVATPIIAAAGSLAFGTLMAGVCLISAVSVWALDETSGQSII